MKLRIGGFLIAALLTASAVKAQPPGLATWEANMLSFGASWCANYDTLTPSQAVDASYYDAIRVFHQIALYTGDTATWYPCVDKAIAAYRDGYVVPNNGGLQGFWTFTKGLRLDYEITADAVSKSSVIALATNGLHCRATTPFNALETATYSREVAYCVMAYIDAEALGAAPYPQLSTVGANNDYVDLLIDYIDQLFITKDFRCGVPWQPCEVTSAQDKFYLQPFMVALIAQALMREWDRTGDARIEPAITTALDALWAEAWDTTSHSFWYHNWKTLPSDPWPAIGTDIDGDTLPDVVPSSDLNNLMAPAYAWLYARTSNTTYRDIADELFVNATGWGSGSKQFNQQMIYSFEYVSLRSADSPVITTTTLPNGTVGVAYSQLIGVTGGTTPYTNCDETVGALPAGSPAFTSTPEAGGCRIAGTPTGAGTTNFTEQVTDADTNTDTQALSITVAAATPTITTTTVPNGQVSVAYSTTIACSGGTAPRTFSLLSGALCAGTSLNTGTGEISGTPTTAQTCSYTIRCTDDVAATDDQALSNTIEAAAGTITGIVNPGSNTAVIRFGLVGLDRNTSCGVQIRVAGDVVATGTSDSGLATREVVVTGLTAGVVNVADLTCTSVPGPPSTPAQVSFTTFPASTGAQTIPFQFGAPPAILVGAAQCAVECDDDPAFGSSVTVTDTSCDTGGTVNHSLTKGVYYCRNFWKTVSGGELALEDGSGSIQLEDASGVVLLEAGEVTLAMGLVQAIPVP